MRDAASSESADWYVLYTKRGQEFIAREHLERQGYNCFLPTLNVEKIRKGRMEICTEPLFSRYLFIRLDPVSGRWSPVRSTRGVSHFLAFGERLATVPADCIETLRHGIQSAPEPMFRPGDTVTIRRGPFAGLQGIYEIADGEMRATVLVELLHNPQRLKIPMGMLH